MSYGRRKHDNVSHLPGHRVASGNGFQRTADSQATFSQLPQLGHRTKVDRGDHATIMWVRADGTQILMERESKPLSALDVSMWR